MRHVQMLLKPASGLCGLRCRYCFYHDETAKREQASYGIMEEAVLEAVIQRALASATQSCTFSFQGGEPTLAGLDFFRRAVELARLHNKNRAQVCFSLQPNGMDLTPAWADFLAENHFLVGLSLDGVKETHDANRVTPQGGGTFQRVLRAVQLLESHGAAFNILTVVNRQTAPQVERIYRFYQRSRLGYLQFIPCLDPLGEAPGEQD